MAHLPLVKVMPEVLMWRTSTEMLIDWTQENSLKTKILPCNLVDVEQHVFKGLQFLLHLNLFLEKENIRSIYLVDFPEYERDTENWHTFVMSDSESDLNRVIEWSYNFIGWYVNQNLYFQSQPWLPKAHYDRLAELKEEPYPYYVYYPLKSFDGSAVITSEEWGHWKWMQKNCQGRIWRWDEHFYFENGRDATLYKTFADSLTLGADNG